jgi:hypothetical protein
MGSDELPVDVGAIKSSYRSRGFFVVHLLTLYDVQEFLPKFAESL